VYKEYAFIDHITGKSGRRRRRRRRRKEACKKEEEERKLNNLSNDSRQNTPKNCHSGIYLPLPNY